MSFFKSKKSLWAAGVGGVLVGVLLTLAAEEGDRMTSTEEFCTSCHSMEAHVAGTEYYRESAHRATHTGVVAGCGDCHIPDGLAPATWEHVTKGMHDLYATVVRDLDTPEQWAQRRPVLTERARQWFRDTDSATCRHCHEQDAITPRSQTGKSMHAMARKNEMTCIECHTNLVHPPSR